VIRTRAVSRLSTIMLLRVRYLLEQHDRPPLLSDEVVATGITQGTHSEGVTWLTDEDALRLLAEARNDANVPMDEKRERAARALETWPTLDAGLRERIEARARQLEKSHTRIRKAVSLKVRDLSLDPQLPPDLLGILVLQPMA
jgi:hypothetical protein